MPLETVGVTQCKWHPRGGTVCLWAKEDAGKDRESLTPSPQDRWGGAAPTTPHPGAADTLCPGLQSLI